MKKQNKDWNKRPKGCKQTISGMHIPAMRISGHNVEFYCFACGLVDDVGFFEKWFGFNEKIDDEENEKTK